MSQTTQTKIRCPLHGIPDCSPLLNGCSVVIQMHRDYDDLTPEQLVQRLALAEDVCRMYGWSASQARTDREKAAYMVWSEWLQRVGGSESGVVDPQRYAHLSDEAIANLAAERDAIRARVLGRLVDTEPDA